MQPYSKEFRQEDLAACDAGRGTREVAVRFRVSESWVRRIKQERREQGKTAPLIKRKRIPQWMALKDQIQLAILRQPDLTLKELKTVLGTSLSVQTLCRALQQLRLHMKKSPEGSRTVFGLTSTSGGLSGSCFSPDWIQRNGFSLMKHGPKQT
jgi:Transposase and inactivated derivatives